MKIQSRPHNSSRSIQSPPALPPAQSRAAPASNPTHADRKPPNNSAAVAPVVESFFERFIRGPVQVTFTNGYPTGRRSQKWGLEFANRQSKIPNRKSRLLLPRRLPLLLALHRDIGDRRMLQNLRGRVPYLQKHFIQHAVVGIICDHASQRIRIAQR